MGFLGREQGDSFATKRGWVGLFPNINGFAMAYVTPGEGEKPTVMAYRSEVCEGPLACRQVVAQFVKEFDLKGVLANFILPHEAYQMMLYEAPEVEEAALGKAMRWLITDAIDFPMEEAMVDAFLLPRARDSDNAKVAYVVAAKKAGVVQAKSIFNKSTLKLSAVDIPETAIRNIARFHPAQQEGVGFLFLERFGGMLVVVHNGLIEIAKKIEVDLSDFLITPVGSEEVLEALGRALKSVFEDCFSTFSQLTMTTLVLLPSELKLLSVQSFLESTFEKPVSLLDLNTILNFGTVVSQEEQAQVLFAVGGALRQGVGV